MPLPPPDPRLRAPARGTLAQPPNRYGRESREYQSDGWDIAEEPVSVAREVRVEHPNRIITRNDSSDLAFDRSLNPYRGCEHGCIFCYARPSHAWLDLSPGLDFETRLVARPDAPALLARELARPGYRVAPIALGSNTDPWQPVEARHRITRAVLQVLSDHNHPVTITTRSALIERDLDILSDMAARGLAEVGVSIATLDADLARALEPRAPAPARRLTVIRRLTAAGVPVRLMLAPVIPALTDHEVEQILTAARDAGAQAAWWGLLRLPHEVAALFQDWLTRHRPDRAARVLRAIRDTRGGALNDSGFGSRFRGQGPAVALLAQRVAVSTQRLGYAPGLPPLDCSRFAVPPKPGDQLRLF